MKHISTLPNFKQSLIIDNAKQQVIILLENGKRHVLKLQAHYFSNYPLLFVIIKGKRYQVNSSVFEF